MLTTLVESPSSWESPSNYIRKPWWVISPTLLPLDRAPARRACLPKAGKSRAWRRPIDLIGLDLEYLMTVTNISTFLPLLRSIPSSLLSCRRRFTARLDLGLAELLHLTTVGMGTEGSFGWEVYNMQD